MLGNIIDFFKAVPPPHALISWFSFLFILMRIGVMIIDSYKEKKAIENSINDIYWYREVIIPYCLEPLKEFIISQSSDFSLLSSNLNKGDCREYFEKFKKEQGIVINKMLVTKAVDQDIYSTVQNQLEKLEDDIATYFAKEAFNDNSLETLKKTEVETSFHQAFCDIVKKFREEHHSLFK